MPQNGQIPRYGNRRGTEERNAKRAVYANTFSTSDRRLLLAARVARVFLINLSEQVGPCCSTLGFLPGTGTSRLKSEHSTALLAARTGICHAGESKSYRRAERHNFAVGSRRDGRTQRSNDCRSSFKDFLRERLLITRG